MKQSVQKCLMIVFLFNILFLSGINSSNRLINGSKMSGISNSEMTPSSLSKVDMSAYHSLQNEQAINGDKESPYLSLRKVNFSETFKALRVAAKNVDTEVENPVEVSQKVVEKSNEQIMPEVPSPLENSDNLEDYEKETPADSVLPKRTASSSRDHETFGIELPEVEPEGDKESLSPEEIKRRKEFLNKMIKNQKIRIRNEIKKGMKSVTDEQIKKANSSFTKENLPDFDIDNLTKISKGMIIPTGFIPLNAKNKK